MLRPVAEVMFDDFIFIAGDQVVNQMAKLRYIKRVDSVNYLS